MSGTQFDEFADVLKNMTPAYRQKLIDNHQKFHQLRSLCNAKGWIEIMDKMIGIKVLKNTPEVAELKKVIDFLKPGSFKWTAKKKKKRT